LMGLSPVGLSEVQPAQARAPPSRTARPSRLARRFVNPWPAPAQSAARDVFKRPLFCSGFLHVSSFVESRSRRSLVKNHQKMMKGPSWFASSSRLRKAGVLENLRLPVTLRTQNVFRRQQPAASKMQPIPSA
jgi:hypothetical protein